MSLERIRHYIDNPPENSRVFEIAPEMAVVILDDYNIGNRTKKPEAIGRFAQHMTNLTWLLTGDTLKFSDAGRLRDGQNRLRACIKSGMLFKTHVVFGIPDNAFDVIDRGSNRTSSDVLHMAGYQNTNALAGAIRWTHLIMTGRAKQRDVFQPEELRVLLQSKYPDLVKHVQQSRAIMRLTGQPLGVVIAMLYLFHKANRPVAMEFASAWETGDRGGRFKPLELLQKEIANQQAQSSGRIHDVVRVALIIKSWNLVINKRRGSQSDMRWKPADHFPEIAS